MPQPTRAHNRKPDPETPTPARQASPRSPRTKTPARRRTRPDPATRTPRQPDPRHDPRPGRKRQRPKSPDRHNPNAPPTSTTLEHRVTPRQPRQSPRTAQVAFQYGIPTPPAPITVLAPVTVPMTPGSITLVVGPSGSGKSTLLTALRSACPNARLVHRAVFRRDVAILDAVAPCHKLGDALAILSACALGEARLWLRCFDELSDGEQFRARLARTIGLHDPRRPAGPIICDEFAASLHRRAALALACNLRKLTTRHNLTVILATPRDDLAADLQPDTVVHCRGAGRCDVTPQTIRPRCFSLRRRTRIEPGRKRDYEAFTDMHYRRGDELGFVDKVFLLRLRGSDQPLGIVVYSHPPLELALRNRATDGYFVRRPDRVNAELRILRRLVIHPDVRGCGLGHYLVRKTLPEVGTPYVECLAAMGAVNPVFEKSGMERIGQYGLDQPRRQAVEALTTLGIDPLARDFAVHVCRKPAVRRIVARVVANWYQATTGAGRHRVHRQGPEFLARTFRSLIGNRPVYYLWRRKA